MTAAGKPWRANFKPVERGPQHGAPPSLEFIALDRLAVDPAYQRAADSYQSRRIIVGMVKGWDWTLCQPLVVSRRLDGTLWILDGQHRHAGAAERGDIAHLPCVVISVIALDSEARTFVKINTERQRLSQLDIFNAMLVAGDPAAHEVALLLDQTGWRMTRKKNVATWQPGEMISAPKLVRQLQLYGAVPVRAALSTLRRAYPHQAVRATATVLLGLIQIYRGGTDRPWKLGTDRCAELAAAMSRVDPATWLGRGQARAATDGVSEALGVAAVIRDCLDNPGPIPLPAPLSAPGLPAPRLPAPSPAGSHQGAAEKPKAAAAPASSCTRPAFGSSGKGWCTQCEALVDQPRARICKSSFCKLKAFA